MYHAAHAAQLPTHASPRTHKDLATMLGMHRVKSGEISVDLYRAFVAARDQREYGDYEVATIIGPEAAERTVVDAAAFIDAVETLLRRSVVLEMLPYNELEPPAGRPMYHRWRPAATKRRTRGAGSVLAS